MLYDMQFRNQVFNKVLPHMEFWRARGNDNLGVEGFQRIARGTIVLGCDPKSLLDEHPIDGEKTQDNECCTTRTADLLRIRKRPELKRLIAHTKQNDTRGPMSDFEIGSLINALFEQDDEFRKREGADARGDRRRLLTDVEQRANIKLAWTLLMPLLLKQDLYKPALVFFQKDKNVIRKPIKFGGRDILIVASENDHSRFVTAATSGKADDQAHVVIRRSAETGHVAIMTNREMFAQDRGRVDQELGEALERLDDPEDPDNSRKRSMSRAGKIVDRKAKQRLGQALSRTVAALRSKEMDELFLDTSKLSQEQLGCVGDFSLVPKGYRDLIPLWHWHEALAGIYNGGFRGPDVPPTEISLEEIVDIVVQAFTG